MLARLAQLDAPVPSPSQAPAPTKASLPPRARKALLGAAAAVLLAAGCALLILGLLWIIVYYLTQGLFPIVQIGGWNILVGFGIALVGFLMMSRWSE